MLNINIVGVVTCSANSTRRLVNSFHYHFTQFHFCNVSVTIQKKRKFNKNSYKILSTMLLLMNI